MAERTPFGLKLAELRAERGMSLKTLARRLNVTPAYLSALETGARGVASPRLLHQLYQVFAIIWDEADALAALARESNPQPKLDVRGKSADHVRLANVLAAQVPTFSKAQVASWLQKLEPPNPSDHGPGFDNLTPD